MRALLFNPWVKDFAAFDLWMRPMSLLRLGGLLRRLGWEVDWYDCMDRRIPLKAGLHKPRKHRLNPYGCGHYYQEIVSPPPALQFVPRSFKRFGTPPELVEATLKTYPPPEVVFIPCMMTYWYLGAFEAIHMMRRVFPKASIVLGGVYATLCYEHAVKYSGADMVLRGESWPGIVRELYRRLGVRQEVPGDQSTWIEPAYDLLGGDTCYPALVTTGCPYHCTYCATHALWPKFCGYEPGGLADSMERCVRNWGAMDFAFYDDALLMKKHNHFLPLMEEIIRRDLSLRFHTPNAVHVSQIDEETAVLMKRAGFKHLRLGFETAQGDLQRETGGKVNTEEYRYAMACLRRAGFTAWDVGTYVLVGIPEQSRASLWEACEVVHEAGSEIKLAMYSPLPHTTLVERIHNDFHFYAQEEPLLQNNSLIPWRSRHFSDVDLQGLKRFVAEKNQKLRENTGVSAGKSVKNPEKRG